MYLYTLIIPCIVGLFMLSENVLRLIGGNEYSDGVNAFRFLCSAMFFSVFACFYAHSILVPNRKENIFMAATIVSAAANVILNLILIPLIGITGAALTTLVSEVIVLLICSYKSKGLHDHFGAKGMLPIAAGSLSIVVICIVVRLLPVNYILQTLISIICSVISYSVFLIVGKNQVAVTFLSKVSGYLNKKS
jgi:O-antigen/teichoic acid export membrane protein